MLEVQVKIQVKIQVHLNRVQTKGSEASSERSSSERSSSERSSSERSSSKRSLLLSELRSDSEAKRQEDPNEVWARAKGSSVQMNSVQVKFRVF